MTLCTILQFLSCMKKRPIEVQRLGFLLALRDASSMNNSTELSGTELDGVKGGRLGLSYE